MTDQISFFTDAGRCGSHVVSGKPGIQNDCGVYANVEFREGANIEVNFARDSSFSIDQTGYGCGHPLCRPCHDCHLEQ